MQKIPCFMELKVQGPEAGMCLVSSRRKPLGQTEHGGRRRHTGQARSAPRCEAAQGTTPTGSCALGLLPQSGLW